MPMMLKSAWRTIAKYTKQGYEVGICDLTEADLSSNGTIELRKEEAKAAARIMGVKTRLNLAMPDRGLYMKEEYIREIVKVIRTYKPKLVLRRIMKIVIQIMQIVQNLWKKLFFSGNSQIYARGSTTSCGVFYHYMINGFHKPNFCIDISEYVSQKVEALEAYESQFSTGSDGVKTPLTEGYVETVVAREKMFGKEVGVLYAEGFMSKKPVLLHADLIGDVNEIKNRYYMLSFCRWFWSCWNRIRKAISGTRA